MAHRGKDGTVPYTIAGDIHTHTLASRHAYSTISENVAAARAAGVEVLGSTDHFSMMLYPEQHIRNFQFFINQGIWPREWDGVTVLRGAEVDIVSLAGTFFGQDIPCPEGIVGHLNRPGSTLFDIVTRDLDYLIASVHNGMFADGVTVAQTTAMYTAVLESPRVLVLGHAGRSGIPFDIDEVLTVARENHKLIEINNHSLESRRHHDVCQAIAERAAELGVGIVVSSDAHIAPAIGKFPCAERMLEEIHFPEELIMNRGRAAMLGAMAAAGLEVK